MDLGLLPIVGLLSLALLYLEALRREHTTRRDWEVRLSPKAERTCAAIAERMLDNAQLVDLALRRAGEFRDNGALEPSARALAAARRLTDQYVRDALALLHGMARFSRLVGAMPRVPALRPGALRSTRVVWRVQVAHLVHPFLVTAGERFRLRMAVARSGFVLLRRVVAREEAREPGREVVDWGALEAARADLETLTHETLAGLRVLLGALSAQPRARGSVVTEESRS